MFKIVYKITAENLLGNTELDSWLEDKFFLNTSGSDGAIENDLDFTNLDRYGRKFVDECPDSLDLSLFWIRNSTIGFSNVNQLGKLCYYHIWPLFFRKFPLGQIWIIESPKSWGDKILEDRRSAAEKMFDYDKNYPLGYPQEFSGLETESFPQNALNILSYGIYPLISCGSILTGIKSDLTILYIPDRSFKHSQMMEAKTLYTRILWDFHHVYDDQWTFDGSRGPKSAINEVILNAINQLDYFEWFINKINQRMVDILNIEDPLLREKLVMTVNRAIADAILSISSQLPYMSMTFFFNFLDKMANIMHLLNIENDDVTAWKKFIDKDFLSNEVLETIKEVPGKVGEHLRNVITNVVEELEYSELSPDDLRDLRNTNHGYYLTRPASFNRLMKKDGELNNDIPLIATPLIVYLFSIPWKFNGIDNQ